MDSPPNLPSSEPKTKIQFPNLNALRFLAAAAVIVHHVELTKAFLGLPNIAGVRAIPVIGPLGVVLFFVLSGFLITYLLLVEERTAGRISIRRFYTRRILRIWPLYYVVVSAGLFLLPHISALRPLGERSMISGRRR